MEWPIYIWEKNPKFNIDRKVKYLGSCMFRKFKILERKFLYNQKSIEVTPITSLWKERFQILQPLFNLRKIITVLQRWQLKSFHVQDYESSNFLEVLLASTKSKNPKWSLTIQSSEGKIFMRIGRDSTRLYYSASLFGKLTLANFITSCRINIW